MGRQRFWTEERLLLAAHEWVQAHGAFPSSRQWKKFSDTPPMHPSARHVQKLLPGGWVEFRKLYEESLTSKGNLKKGDDRRREPWTEEEIVGALQRFGEEHGRPPTVLDTKSRDTSLPSLSAVTRVLGSWNAAMRAAGFVTVPRGLTHKAVNRYMPLPRDREGV